MSEETKNYSDERLDKSGVLDRIRKRLVSRKFMVWLTATGIVATSHFTGADVEHAIDAWTAISLGYIGIQGVADIAATWRHGNNDVA
jgi:hypothetical protein